MPGHETPGLSYPVFTRKWQRYHCAETLCLAAFFSRCTSPAHGSDHPKVRLRAVRPALLSLAGRKESTGRGPVAFRAAPLPKVSARTWHWAQHTASVWRLAVPQQYRTLGGNSSCWQAATHLKSAHHIFESSRALPLQHLKQSQQCCVDRFCDYISRTWLPPTPNHVLLSLLLSLRSRPCSSWTSYVPRCAFAPWRWECPRGDPGHEALTGWTQTSNLK